MTNAPNTSDSPPREIADELGSSAPDLGAAEPHVDGLDDALALGGEARVPGEASGEGAAPDSVVLDSLALEAMAVDEVAASIIGDAVVADAVVVPIIGDPVIADAVVVPIIGDAVVAGAVVAGAAVAGAAVAGALDENAAGPLDASVGVADLETEAIDSDAALALAQPVALAAAAPLAADLQGPPPGEHSRLPSSVGLPDPRLGETLNGRYRLDKLIGKGGMGRVYRATQFPLNRPVALKILSPDFQKKDPQFVRRFYLEAATAARLSHPNTITVFDYGESEQGELFIVMEYLRGRALSRVISSEGPFAAERALHVGMQICRALREAHGKGIVHRDLKPGNIMLLEEGDDSDFVKVLDFGLVKVIAGSEDDSDGIFDPVVPDAIEADLTRAGMFLGSPKYMSPEQINGSSLDVRTDIYSLGVLMFHMCAGKPPYTGSTSVEIVYKHVHEPIPRVRDVAPQVDLPAELEEIIRRCLAKDRRARFATMGDLLIALKAAHRSISGASVGADTGVSIADLSSVVQTYDLDNSALMPVPGSPMLRPAGRLPSTSQGLREAASVTAPEARPELHFAEIDDTSPAPARAARADSVMAPPRASLLAPMLAGFALIVVVAVGAFVWLGQPQPTPVSIPPLGGIPRPTDAQVLFRSTPPGAEVIEDGRVLGRTPFEHRFALGDAAPRSRRFVFRLAGHLDASLAADLEAGSVELNARLQSDAPPAGDESEREPSYKDNPY